jgi:peptidylprolyl isomerase
MTQAKAGDTVKVHYTGTLEDGTPFDSSVGKTPLEFTLGSQQVIAGFEDAVVGMAPGEEKSTRIDVENAYGPRREDMVLAVEASEFPSHISPAEGQMLQMEYEDGQTISVLVTEVSDTLVTLDANHPLAGEALIFDIQLLEIV